ncbi:hypothetical protein KBD08_02615 [Candidatus Babeliales bacterium]|nr:hypothetical protein [Candidatus Babeliales bacterium]
MKVVHFNVMLSLFVYLCVFITPVHGAYVSSRQQEQRIVKLLNMLKEVSRYKKSTTTPVLKTSISKSAQLSLDLRQKALDAFNNEFLTKYDELRVNSRNKTKRELINLAIESLRRDELVKVVMRAMADDINFMKPFIERHEERSPVSLPISTQSQQVTLPVRNTVSQNQTLRQRALDVFNNEFLIEYDRLSKLQESLNDGVFKGKASIGVLIDRAIDNLLIDERVKDEMKVMRYDIKFIKALLSEHEFLPLLKQDKNIIQYKNKYPELYKVLEKYYCSEEFIKLYQDIFIKSMKTNINRFARIINAARMKNYLKTQPQLASSIAVADKCIVDKAGVWGLIAQKITAVPLIFNLKEVQYLAQIAQDTGFIDWGEPMVNILRDQKTGKIVFIDTEDASFELIQGRQNQLHYLQKFYASISRYGSGVSDDTVRWLDGYIKQFKNTSTHTPSLPFNSRYDDPGIDFEQAKIEFAQMLKAIGKHDQ